MNRIFKSVDNHYKGENNEKEENYCIENVKINSIYEID